MKRLLVLLLLVAPPAIGQGRFCVVTNYGQSCHYYDANACRSEALRQGGMCVLNQQQTQPQPDIAGSVIRGFEAGRRVAPPQQGTCPSQVVYRCGDDYATYPRVGCTVINVVP